MILQKLYKSLENGIEAMLQSYYNEFGTSAWEKFKANLAYRFLRTDYKIIGELNGRTIIGAFRYAELIAVELLYSQLKLKTDDDKIRVLEGMYFLEKNKQPPVSEIRDKKTRLEMLEIFCKPYIFSKVRNGKVRLS